MTWGAGGALRWGPRGGSGAEPILWMSVRDVPSLMPGNASSGKTGPHFGFALAPGPRCFAVPDTDLICDRQTPLSRLASGNGLLSRTDLGISLVLAAFCEDLLCVPAKLLGFRIHSSSLMTALDGRCKRAPF